MDKAKGNGRGVDPATSQEVLGAYVSAPVGFKIPTFIKALLNFKQNSRGRICEW